MTQLALDTFATDCKKAIDFLHAEYAKLQTGRANAITIENIAVDAYGQSQPLKAVAGITVENARTLVVQPWDNGVLADVEKALVAADLGTSPSNDGAVIRIVLPPMTEERRTILVKTVHKLAEDARVSVRNHRHDAKTEIEKEEDKDVKFTELEKLQKQTDDANHQIDESMKNKEQEVMTV